MFLNNLNITKYYDEHAASFFEQTFYLPTDSLSQFFMEKLPQNSRVLDAGCGTGRDAKYFAEQGLIVEAFDASEELVKLARIHTALEIQHSSFLTFKSTNKYDGIWACASLLHVPFNELSSTIEYLASYLKFGGIFYLSFKYGDQERVSNGRFFAI